MIGQTQKGETEVMLIDNTVIYEENYLFQINQKGRPFFYFFDWDERTYAINMEFQHFHPFYEMCIFLGPHAQHLINGVRHDLRCCDIVAIRPALLHKTAYPQGAPCKRLIINFALPALPAELGGCMQTIYQIFEKEVPIYRFEGHTKQTVFEKLNDIYYLSKSPNELSDLAAHNKFIEFLSLIYLYRDKNVYEDRTVLDNTSAKIYGITAHIHTHYMDELSLSGLSKEFFISSCYLSHQFKRITGFTLTDYISMTRVRNAQNLLLSTNMPVTDIALSCGFKSFSQFNRTFRRFVEMPPSKFRKDS